MSLLKESGLLMKKTRLEVFSDGVFAIVITLLILEIKVPDHVDLDRAGGMYSYLKEIWPSYLAYGIAFLMIGIYWSNHHHLNILFLMAIAFMPFTTAMFGRFILDQQYHNGAVTVYCVGILLPVYVVYFILLWKIENRNI